MEQEQKDMETLLSTFTESIGDQQDQNFSILKLQQFHGVSIQLLPSSTFCLQLLLGYLIDHFEGYHICTFAF